MSGLANDEKRQRDERGHFASTIECGRKFCSKCGKWKLLLYFTAHRWNDDGTLKYLQPTCASCKNRYEKQHRKNLQGDDRLRQQEYERTYRQKVRKKQGVKVRGQGYSLEGKASSVASEPLIRFIKQWLIENNEEEKGLYGSKQTELARLAGVDPKRIYEILEGKRISLRTADAICIFLGLHFDIVYDRED